MKQKIDVKGRQMFIDILVVKNVLLLERVKTFNIHQIKQKGFSILY